MSRPSFGVILPAAGSSSRFGGSVSKVFLNLQGREVWQWSADVFLTVPAVQSVVVVVSPAEIQAFRDRHAEVLADLRLTVVPGGECRSQSVRNGMLSLAEDIDFVAVHDAARPLITAASIRSFFQEAATHTACIPATRVTSTVKRVSATGRIKETLDRSELRLAQTPQVVARSAMIEAYDRAEDLADFTDEASLIEAMGQDVFVADGWTDNIKLTTPSDLKLAEMILDSRTQA